MHIKWLFSRCGPYFLNILFYVILFCFVLFCFVLFYFILFFNLQGIGICTQFGNAKKLPPVVCSYNISIITDAFQAGLAKPSDSSQLLIALEPEAAAVYCRQRKLREFVEEKGEETVMNSLVPAKTQYLVIDNGGKSQNFIINAWNPMLCSPRVSSSSFTVQTLGNV